MVPYMGHGHLLQQTVGAFSHIRGGAALIKISAHSHIFKQGQVTDKVDLLKYKPEIRIPKPCKLFLLQPDNIPAVIDDLPRGSSVHAA